MLFHNMLSSTMFCGLNVCITKEADFCGFYMNKCMVDILCLFDRMILVYFFYSEQ